MTDTQADTPLDLADFEDVTTAQVVLKNPVTGAPTTAVVQLAGPEHPTRKKIAFDRARKLRAEFQRSGKMSVTDPLDDIEDETDYLVHCTLGWTGLSLDYSPANARSIFTDPKRQWVRAQVRKALDEAERFIAGSAKA